MTREHLIAKASHRHLAKGASAYAGSRGLSAILALGVTAVLTRYLGPMEFGAWTVLLAAFQLITAADLGFTAGVRMRVLKLLARGNAKGAIRTFLQSLFILGGFCALLGTLAILFVPLTGWLGLPGSISMRISAWITVEIALVALPIGIAVNLLFSYMEAATVSLMETLRGVSQSGLVILLAAFHAPFEWLVLAYYGSYLLVTCLGFWVFVKRRHITWSDIARYRRANLRHMMRWLGRMLGRSLLFCTTATAYAFAVSGGAIILSHLLSLAAVGDYGLLMRIITAALGLHAAFMTSYSGGYGTRYFSGDLAWIKRSLLLFSSVTFLAWIPCALVLVLFGQDVIQFIFGVHISDQPLIVWVSVWSLLMGLYQVFWLFLQSVGSLKVQALASVAIAALNVWLMIILIPRIGVVGAVIAPCISFIIWLAITLVQTAKLVCAKPALTGLP